MIKSKWNDSYKIEILENDLTVKKNEPRII